MTDELLTAYDAQLRGGAETDGATQVTRIGPLWLAVFDESSQGFITYHELDGYAGEQLDRLIETAIAHFRDATVVAEFEWKTRGHDHPADLSDRLTEHGLVAEDLETVMVGEAEKLALELPLPDGVVVRRAGEAHDLADDVERADALSLAVFGRGSGRSSEAFMRELVEDAEHTSLWIAEAGGRVVCSGRLKIVPGTEFAGLWGGATHPDWRRRGIYRVLTAARAQHALARGVRYLHSDSSDMSKPILERSGLHAITTTTPYIWRRG